MKNKNNRKVDRRSNPQIKGQDVNAEKIGSTRTGSELHRERYEAERSTSDRINSTSE